jgi:hypothetical protein
VGKTILPSDTHSKPHYERRKKILRTVLKGIGLLVG